MTSSSYKEIERVKRFELGSMTKGDIITTIMKSSLYDQFASGLNPCKLADLEPLLKKMGGFDKEIEMIKRFKSGNPTPEDIKDLLKKMSESSYRL